MTMNNITQAIRDLMLEGLSLNDAIQSFCNEYDFGVQSIASQIQYDFLFYTFEHDEAEEQKAEYMDNCLWEDRYCPVEDELGNIEGMSLYDAIEKGSPYSIWTVTNFENMEVVSGIRPLLADKTEHDDGIYFLSHHDFKESKRPIFVKQ